MQRAIDRALYSYDESMFGADIKAEISTYEHLVDVCSFMNMAESDISSSAYVVDTLEAALYCFLTTNSYEECVLKAVNLGNDSDTTASVAGALAGAFYGLRAIPEKWLHVLAKREEIEKMCTNFSLRNEK